MTRRVFHLPATLVVILAVMWLTGAPVAAQAPPPTVQTPNNWTPPRTAWGDPDIQGNFTNLWEAGTPFERPAEFDGRRLEDIARPELEKIRLEMQRQTREQQLAGEIGGTRWIWLDSHNHAKGSMAWFVLDPPDGRIPPTTPEAQVRQAARAAARRGRGPADSYEDRSLYDRCITLSVPGSMTPKIYGNSYQIVQAPGYVAIRYEMVHETRIIPLDGDPRLGQNIPQDMGDARGHWDGTTLVVETTNFADRSAYRGADPRTFRLVERFTRVAPDKVWWTVTVNDPTTWTRPWTFGMPLTEDNHEALFEYSCHEGNYAMSHILSGARAEDKAIQEAAKKGIAIAPRPSSPDEAER